MAKVTVYRVIVWNQSAGNSYVSRRMATEKGAAMMGGKIAPDTGVEIELGSTGARRGMDGAGLRL